MVDLRGHSGDDMVMVVIGGVISLFEVCGLEEGAEEEEDEHGDDGVEEDVDANTDDEDEGEDSTIVVTSHDTK